MISIGGCTNDKRGVSGSPLEVMFINSKTYKDRDNDNNNYNTMMSTCRSAKKTITKTITITRR